MPFSEFDLIRRYFQDATPLTDDVCCGIGDDAAIVRVPAGRDLVLAMDTLVAGVHFPKDALPDDIGYKSLAVNLSDLAAMGAEPCWITLSLTLPEPDENWLQSFMDGFGQLAREYRLSLIGGDTTSGPLSITLQVHGLVPEGQALKRNGARPGDRVYVSGHPGDAALALDIVNGKTTGVSEQQKAYVLSRFNRPTPRLKLGRSLRGIASSAIDISDGLAADLGHILEAGSVGADLQLAQLPLSEALQVLPAEQAWQLALSGGDDYELCFTVPESKSAEIDAHSLPGCPLTCIGTISEEKGQRWWRPDGNEFKPAHTGYRHF